MKPTALFILISLTTLALVPAKGKDKGKKQEVSIPKADQAELIPATTAAAAAVPEPIVVHVTEKKLLEKKRERFEANLRKKIKEELPNAKRLIGLGAELGDLTKIINEAKAVKLWAAYRHLQNAKNRSFKDNKLKGCKNILTDGKPDVLIEQKFFDKESFFKAIENTEVPGYVLSPVIVDVSKDEEEKIKKRAAADAEENINSVSPAIKGPEKQPVPIKVPQAGDQTANSKTKEEKVRRKT